MSFSIKFVATGMFLSFSSGVSSYAIDFTKEKLFYCLQDRIESGWMRCDWDPDYLLNLELGDLNGKSLIDLISMYVCLKNLTINKIAYSKAAKSNTSPKIILKSNKKYLEDYISVANVKNKNAPSGIIGAIKTKTGLTAIKPTSVYFGNQRYSNKVFPKSLLKLDKNCKEGDFEPNNSKICKKESNVTTEVHEGLRTKLPSKTFYKEDPEYRYISSPLLILEKINFCIEGLLKDYICGNSLEDILNMQALEKVRISNFPGQSDFYKALFYLSIKNIEDLETCTDAVKKHCLFSVSSPQDKLVLDKVEILKKIAYVLSMVYAIPAGEQIDDCCFENFLFLVNNSMHVLNLREVSRSFMENFSKELLNALRIYGSTSKKRINEHNKKTKVPIDSAFVTYVLKKLPGLNKSENVVEDTKDFLHKVAGKKGSKGEFFKQNVKDLRELKENTGTFFSYSLSSK